VTDAFLAEVRDWLAAHVPAKPLPSLDTAEGFERHRAWERELAAARLSVVSWPARYRRAGARAAPMMAVQAGTEFTAVLHDMLAGAGRT
jgi:hypothetical protein